MNESIRLHTFNDAVGDDLSEAGACMGLLWAMGADTPSTAAMASTGFPSTMVLQDVVALHHGAIPRLLIPTLHVPHGVFADAVDSG